MADIFISYAREDRAFTQILASRLEERGWSVWWDRRIPIGRRFERVIEEELHRAGCVIAVWSRHGIASDYVCEEAADGRDRGILLPVFAEAVNAPFGFRGIQAADLRDWKGDTAHSAFVDFLQDISTKIGPPRRRAEPRGTEPPADDGATVQAARAPKREGESRPSLATRRRLGVAGLTLLIATGVGWWWSGARGPKQAPPEHSATAAPSAGATSSPSTAPIPRPDETRSPPGAEKTASAPKKLAPGDVFRDCDACPQMVVVPAGQFLMGSPGSEKERFGDDEGPQHAVTIAAPFAISKYEVTFDEWDACVAAGGCDGYRPDDRGWGRGRRPVINVSWRDAKAYVKWLSEKTGKPYRLPSEAEWEYAARAGTTTRYSWGNTITPKNANYDESKLGKTSEVGQYPANRWGLYDMHGNVWEWVEDIWHDGYRGAPTDGSAWTDGEGIESSRNRGLRGGSWYNSPEVLRSAYRGRFEPDYRGSSQGIRVARTLP